MDVQRGANEIGLASSTVFTAAQSAAESSQDVPGFGPRGLRSELLQQKVAVRAEPQP